MADHPPETSVADQGDSPQSKEPTKTVAETAPETNEEEDKDNEETQKDLKDKGKDKDDEEEDKEEGEEVEEGEEEESAPPLPDEVPPPLPDEAPPGEDDDGWEPVWDGNVQAYYFYNRFTRVSQWENPRVPNPSTSENPSGLGDDNGDESPAPPEKQTTPVVGGYNPAIHGDYDPTAPYAQQYEQREDGQLGSAGGVTGNPYEATGHFNRFTGRWQESSLQPDNYNDENKSHRQMSAFFDVDTVSGGHDGRSLRAERSAKKLSKKELKAFKDKRREKKEEKRRAWLRD